MFSGNTKAYMFPLFNLITEIVAKVEQNQTYSITALLAATPSETFIHPKTKKIHPMWRELQQIGCHFLRKAYITVTLQKTSWYSNHGEHLYKANIKWYKLCTEKSINPFEIHLTFAVNFLMKIKMNGGNFGAVNNARSTLSSIISNDSIPFGQNQ